MTELAPRFQYHPPVLENDRTFRVLRLHPASCRDDVLQFDLQTYSLDHRHFYDTISYTWDAQPFDVQALCEGKLFFISRNCHRILTILRREDRERLIWIDQICINQSSLEDRSLNVTNMGDIYRYSGDGFIWLGELDAKLKEFLLRISGTCRASVRECDDDPVAVSKKMFWGGVDFDYRGDADKKLYLEFVSTPWFHRIWTFQEFVVPCHDAVYFLVDDALLSYMRISVFEIQYIIPYSNTLWGLQKFKQTLYGQHGRHNSHTSDNWTLSLLLEYLIGRQCGDPRDKIFAVLASLKSFWTKGRESDNLALPLSNYSLSVSEIYEKASLWALSEKEDVRMLYLAAISPHEASRREQLREHCISDLPSWVPDLNYLSYLDRPVKPNVFLLHNSAVNRRSPCANSKLTFEYVPSDRAILLKGIICDTLHFVGTEFVPSGEDDMLAIHEEYSIVGCWLSEIRAYAQRHSDFNCTDKRFLSIIKSASSGDLPRGESEHSQSVDEEYICLAEKIFNGGEFNAEVARSDGLKQCEKTGLVGQFHRTLLISQHARIGTGLGDSRAGDKVAVAAGFDQLLILRPLERYYKLIGHASMDGLMNGEAWPGDESKLMDIEIR